MSDERGTLEHALSVAVPMWVVELQDKPIDSLLPRTEGYAQFVGQYGDQLQFGGKKCAECFNKVAEGLAVLSMVCPGGVKFGDMHFEFPHKDLK